MREAGPGDWSTERNSQASAALWWEARDLAGSSPEYVPSQARVWVYMCVEGEEHSWGKDVKGDTKEGCRCEGDRSQVLKRCQ